MIVSLQVALDWWAGLQLPCSPGKQYSAVIQNSNHYTHNIFDWHYDLQILCCRFMVS